MGRDVLEEAEADRRRNREEAIRHARWEAEMARRLGVRWFEARDEWLTRAHEADVEMWRDPRVREALLRAIQARDRAARGTGVDYRPPGMARLARGLAIPGYMGFPLDYCEPVERRGGRSRPATSSG